MAADMVDTRFYDMWLRQSALVEMRYEGAAQVLQYPWRHLRKTALKSGFGLAPAPEHAIPQTEDVCPRDAIRYAPQERDHRLRHGNDVIEVVLGSSARQENVTALKIDFPIELSEGRYMDSRR
jgi:hypothetical protein